MVKKASDIEKEVSQLPPRERARLARSLIDSLDVERKRCQVYF